VELFRGDESHETSFGSIFFLVAPLLAQELVARGRLLRRPARCLKRVQATPASRWIRPPTSAKHRTQGQCHKLSCRSRSLSCGVQTVIRFSYAAGEGVERFSAGRSALRFGRGYLRTTVCRLQCGHALTKQFSHRNQHSLVSAIGGGSRVSGDDGSIAKLIGSTSTVAPASRQLCGSKSSPWPRRNLAETN
jgi:hypothetical protein